MYVLQIENEYNHIQLAYETDGDSYVQWAAKLAVSLYNEVPWIMCKQKDAPDPVVSSMYNQFGIIFPFRKIKLIRSSFRRLMLAMEGTAVIPSQVQTNHTNHPFGLKTGLLSKSIIFSLRESDMS